MARLRVFLALCAFRPRFFRGYDRPQTLERDFIIPIVSSKCAVWGQHGRERVVMGEATRARASPL